MRRPSDEWSPEFQAVRPTLTVSRLLSGSSLIVMLLAAGSCREASAPTPPPPTAEELADLRPDPPPSGSPEQQAREWLHRIESGRGSVEEYQRQRRQLTRLGAGAVPVLREVLTRHAEDRPQLVDNACDLLAEISDASAVPELIGLVEGSNGALAAKASTALGKIGDPRAIEPLARRLRAEPTGSRAPYLQALAGIRDKASAEILREELAPDRPLASRVLALRLLGGMGQTSVLPDIEPLAKSREEAVRIEAAEALIRLGRAGIGVTSALDVLATGSPESRSRVIELLAASGDSRAVDVLFRIASGNDPLRAKAAWAVAEFADAARSQLQLLAAHPDQNVSRAARLGLVQAGDSTVRAELVKDLSNGPPDARRQALEILTQVRAPDAVPPLLQWLRSTREPEDRQMILRSLSKIGDPTALPTLLDFLFVTQDDPDAWTEPSKAIANLGELALPSLEKAYLERLRPASLRTRLRIIRTLGLIARDETLGVLERLFRAEEDPGLRMALRTTARSVKRYL